ncbi:MAG: DUF4097 family beta strand repeat-containing protein [Bacillota bacterium]
MKRLTLIFFYVLLGLGTVAGTFSLLALTSGTAYAHGTADDGDRSGDTRSVNETRPAKPDADIRIDNLAGTVHIKAWDKNQVNVNGHLGEDVERLEINGDQSDIEIRVVVPHHGNCGDNCDADLDIYVPAGSRVEVSTVSADVDAQGLAGQVHMGTVSGNIVLTTSATRIEAKSTSGDVSVTGSAKGARISANSISGTVRVMHVDGNLDAESVSGDVKVSNSSLVNVTTSSTSGNLTYDSPLQKGGQYEFNNVSGDLTLVLGGSPDARFDISSFSGDIDNSFGPKPTRVSKYSPGVELHFTNGNGAAQVSARTLSGDVHLQN